MEEVKLLEERAEVVSVLCYVRACAFSTPPSRASFNDVWSRRESTRERSVYSLFADLIGTIKPLHQSFLCPFHLLCKPSCNARVLPPYQSVGNVSYRW